MPTCRHSQDDLLKFKVEQGDLGKKGNLSDFDCGMVIGARRAGLNSSESADLLGFFHRAIVGFTKKRKYPVHCSSPDENASLIPEVTGQWPGCFELKGNSNNNSLQLKKDKEPL